MGGERHDVRNVCSSRSEACSVAMVCAGNRHIGCRLPPCFNHSGPLSVAT